VLRHNNIGPEKPRVYTHDKWVYSNCAVKKFWLHDEVDGVTMNKSAGQSDSSCWDRGEGSLKGQNSCAILNPILKITTIT